MGMAASIKRWWNGPPTARRRTRGEQAGFSYSGMVRKGGYDGARSDRLSDDWNPGALPPNLLHRMDAGLLRQRARDLVRNNPLAASAINCFAANVINTGIAPRIAPELWPAWELWQRSEADVTRRQTFYSLQETLLREVLVGGGCLVHYVDVDRRRNRGQRRRRLPLAVELLPEERFCEQQDAFARAGTRPGQNPIVRGVELDRHTSEPLAYWVWPALPGELGTVQMAPVRLPAEECRYAFSCRELGQVRGITALAPAIVWLWRLGYYQENELMSSAIASCYALAITTLDDDPQGLGNAEGEDATDFNGNLMERVEPGTILRLQPGEDAKGIAPGHPNGQAEPWLRLITRSIAAALDLSYQELMRDTAEANFSAARFQANADQIRFRRLQTFVIDHFAQPTYERWLTAETLAGTQNFPTPQALVAGEAELTTVKWRTPGWRSMDPETDAKALAIELKNGVTTRDDYLSTRGQDYEEVFDQLEREDELAEQKGLELERPKAATDGSGAEPADRANQEADRANQEAGR